MPSVEAAAIIGVLMNSTFFMLMGFNPPSHNIRQGYKWLYAITPQRYPLAVLVVLVFAGCSEMPVWGEETGMYSGGGSELDCQLVTNTPVSIDHTTVKERVACCGMVSSYFHRIAAVVRSVLQYRKYSRMQQAHLVLVLPSNAMASARLHTHPRRTHFESERTEFPLDYM